VIKGYVYTLQRTEQDPARLARLDVINGECERLTYLMEDLLELSRARAGSCAPQIDGERGRGRLARHHLEVLAPLEDRAARGTELPIAQSPPTTSRPLPHTTLRFGS
jgi:signal transduction histidine kinase